jgi:hypothetical protein
VIKLGLNFKVKCFELEFEMLLLYNIFNPPGVGMCKKSLISDTNKQRQNITAVNCSPSVDNTCLPFTNGKFVITIIIVFTL